MKLSTRSRYGLRLMFELALFNGKGTVFLKDIAERQVLSEKYLSKLVIPLKAAKLINASRGAHGGYTLAKVPSEITVRQIVEVLEGDICPVECVNNSSVCDRLDLCPTRDIWAVLQQEIYKVLDAVTLQKIIDDYKKKIENGSISYSI